MVDWNKEIVPAFAKLGLTATCEGVAWLEKRLASHPDVEDCFFGGKTRCFDSLAEFRARKAGGILPNAFEQPLLDRGTALERVMAFIADANSSMLVVHGTGGVGKTRFLCEAAVQASRLGRFGAVYCATAAAETSQDWYRGIVAEIPALVIVDEPQDPRFIEILLEQLAGRAKAWKVIIASRSPNHPVLKALRRPRLSCVSRPDLELRALPRDVAFIAATNLAASNLQLSTEANAQAADWLYRVSAGIPIWIAIGVRLLVDRGNLHDLPTDRWGVAEEYLDEIITKAPPTGASATQLTMLLRWIALVQPLNREVGAMLELLRREAVMTSVGDVERALESLRTRRVVSFYGINDRLVEIRPDVMRDFIIREWLTLPDDPRASDALRRPSADATDLVSRMVATLVGNDNVPFLRQAVTALARLEYAMDVQLLDPLAEWTLAAARSATNAAEQSNVLAIATVFGPFRPIVFAQIVDILNTNDVPDGFWELR
jgi:hypothetical protein